MSRGKNNPTRGFVTMATGDEKYFILASNLLRSYKYFSRKHYPWTIITNEENDYTAGFDSVIIIPSPLFSDADKLKVPELTPYDETLFIDADCLAYSDLNELWKLFGPKCPDFSVLGNTRPLDSKAGWMTPEGAGVYRTLIDRKIDYQGGIMFFRKKGLSEFIETCRYIENHYDEFSFDYYPTRRLVDETVFSLAAAVHGFFPSMDWINVFCYLPDSKIIEADILSGKLKYIWLPRSKRLGKGVFLLHFSTSATKEILYQKEAAKLFDNAGNKPTNAVSFRLWIERRLWLFRRFLRPLKMIVPNNVKRFIMNLFIRFYGKCGSLSDLVL